MWHKPWKLREGLAIGAGLLITGEMLQLSMGSIDWQLFAFPVNVVALALYLTLIAAAFLLRRKIYVVISQRPKLPRHPSFLLRC